MNKFSKKLCLLLFLSVSTHVKAQIEQGPGSFLYNQYEPLKDKPLKVWYYSPKKDPADLPVLMVLHGTIRNANVYRDNWIELADKYGILVIAPEFSNGHFPKSRCYNLGNMFNEENIPIEEAKWSYSLIEPLFDHIIGMINGNQQYYAMFGHSAGAQFVHRFAMFKPDNRAHTIISSNAGWYTLPDLQVDFPYGLRNTSASEDQLKKVFQKKMIIQLGEADTDTNHKSLRKTKEALQQGEHRFARGQYFYQQAVQMANALNTDFNWEIRTVPMAGHFNKDMAIPAATYLFREYLVHK